MSPQLVYTNPNIAAAQSDSEQDTGLFSRWGKKLAGYFGKKEAQPTATIGAGTPLVTTKEVEEATSQKRAWLDQQEQFGGVEQLASWPEHLIEAFYVVGLPPDTEITQVAYDLAGQEKPHKDTDTAHSNRTSISQPHSHSQINFNTPHTAPSHGLPSPAINHSGCLPHVNRATSVIQPTSPKSFDRPDGLPTSPFSQGSEQQGHRETVNVSSPGNTGHEQNTAYDKPPSPAYPAQVLFRYPPNAQTSLSDEQVADLCFPNQVTPRRLRRSPSWSALHNVISHKSYISYGNAYIFMVKNNPRLPLYGVCCMVEEPLHRPPSLAQGHWPACSAPYRQCLITAPRAYCITSYYPFFDLLCQALNVVVGLERLNRTLAFSTELQADRTSHVSTHQQPAPTVTTNSNSMLAPRDSLAASATNNNYNNTDALAGTELSDGNVVNVSSNVQDERLDDTAMLSVDVGSSTEDNTNADDNPIDDNVQNNLPTTTLQGSQFSQDNSSGWGVIDAQQLQQGNNGRSQEEALTSSATAAQNSDVADGNPTVADAAEATWQPDFSQMYSEEDTQAALPEKETFNSNSWRTPAKRPEPLSLDTTPASQTGAVRASHARHLSVASFHTAAESEASDFNAALSPSNSQNCSPMPSPAGKNPDETLSTSTSTAVPATSMSSERPVRGPSRLQSVGKELTDDSTFTQTELEQISSFTPQLQKDDQQQETDCPESKDHGDDSNVENDCDNGHLMATMESGVTGPLEPSTPTALHPILPPPTALSIFDSSIATPSTVRGTLESSSQRIGSMEHSQACHGNDCEGYHVVHVTEPLDVLPGVLADNTLPPLATEEAKSQPETVVSPVVEPIIPQFSPLSVVDTLMSASVPMPGDRLQLPVNGLPPIGHTRSLLTRRWPVLAPAPALAAYAEDELAAELAPWSTAILARSLPLDALVSVLNAALLERPVVFFHPNAALLSSCVLGVLPMLRPFTWQFLVLPLMPTSAQYLLDAPVPFLMGCQYKTQEISHKCNSLVRVNLYKGNVSNAANLPQLPGLKRLTAALTPLHARLRNLAPGARMTGHGTAITDEQMAVASEMLAEIYAHLTGNPPPRHDYMSAMSDPGYPQDAVGGAYNASGVNANNASSSWWSTQQTGYGNGRTAIAGDAATGGGVVGDMRPHIITHLGSNGERTATLMRESLIEVQPVKDKAWVKAFMETQIFEVYSDQVMSAQCESRRRSFLGCAMLKTSTSIDSAGRPATYELKPSSGNKGDQQASQPQDGSPNHQQTTARINRLLSQQPNSAHAAAAKLLLQNAQNQAQPEQRRAHDSTFSLLVSQAKSENLTPSDLQELRSARRLLETCATPAAMLRDITCLKYISRGASCVVFQGLWQCSEVAVKMLVSPRFNASSSSVREALLGCELAHPNLVQCYAVRCLELTDEFVVGAKVEHETTQLQRRMSKAGYANIPEEPDMYNWLHHSFDSEDGFGPAPAPPTPTFATQQALGIVLHNSTSMNGTGISTASTTRTKTLLHSHSEVLSASESVKAHTLAALANGRTNKPTPNAAGLPTIISHSAGHVAQVATGPQPPLLNGAVPNTQQLLLQAMTHSMTPDIPTHMPILTTAGGSLPVGIGNAVPTNQPCNVPSSPLPSQTSASAPLYSITATTNNHSTTRATSNSSLLQNRLKLHSRNGTAAYMLPAHDPWLDGVSWHEVLTALKASKGQVLTMLVQELCDLGVLSWAIHKKKLFVPVWRDPRQLALRALLRTAREVALGLNHLHEAGVIHGDLKPANVVLMSSRLDRRGFVAKLTDLGLSRVLKDRKAPFEPFDTEEGDNDLVIEDADWGTTAYMAPEHFRGQLCKASDIFSWGVLVWEMAHATRPHEGLKREDIVSGVLHGVLRLPWDPVLPSDLIKLCRACLCHSPANRPTCHHVIAELGDIEAALREDMRAQRMMIAQQHGQVQQGGGSR